MSNLTPKAEHEMDLIRRRSKAYGESINPKQPSLDEMVAERIVELVDCRANAIASRFHKTARHYEVGIQALLAIQDVLGLSDYPITSFGYEMATDEDIAYNDAMTKVRQTISSRLEVE